MSLLLPPALARPGVVAGKAATKVVLDLTVYLATQSENDLDFLLDLYESICPPGNRSLYTIQEISS